MATNTSLTNNLKVSELDFDTIKGNFKSFLKAQDTFKDYDFEGSSLSILLDLLAYNTHYMSYYANMIANEMFLDTATFRESIVSRSKMLGYTPRSRKSSVAYVDIIVYVNIVQSTTPPSSITLDKYAQFTSSVNDVQYTFVTLESKSLQYSSTYSTTTQWAYVLNNVDIYEGSIVNYSFNVTNPYSTDYYSPKNKYVIPSAQIDTDTLIISVQDSDKVLTTTTFQLADTLVDKNADSTIYWLNETENFYYEIKFGDGVTFGKSLQTGNIINCTYLSTNGSAANGCKVFYSSTHTFTGWPTGLAFEGVSISSTPSTYITLSLSQTYVSNFQVGEEVTGTDSGSKGKVIYWNSATGALTLVPISGYSSTFTYVKTSNGYLGENIIAPSTAVGTITMVAKETSKSNSGAERESNESIKLLAPLSYQSQNRCVTIKDYETLIKKLFYSTVRSIKVWSGESMVEPQYGKVFIAIRPYVGQVLDSAEKSSITNAIKDQNVLSIQPVIVDIDFIYIIPTCTVKYNPAQFTTKGSSIKDVISLAISDFATTYLNEFGSPFYYSEFINYLDQSDASITSVNVSISLKKILDLPFLSSAEGIKVYFSNAIETSSITSSKFVFKYGSIDTVDCQLLASSSDSTVLTVIDSNGDVVTGGENVGSIDYTTGTITFNKFIVSSTTIPHPSYPDLEGRVEIYATSIDNDIFSTEHQVIDISSSDNSNITVTDIRNLL